MWSLSFPAPLKEYIDCIMQDEKTIKFEGKKIDNKVWWDECVCVFD